ncbi:MAG: haloacid dehalogenase type II [Deltaproteobacteria bacterium HGW-Deltaproteobacteria-19]|jgi:2-haloacid dehalogenase|nr:MAG: haloacid dehalogenase type II [Deltaproteobacteria bacterium HGW-Deltaproteobacteria-19]
MCQQSFFTGVKACMFDAYGTLFDFNSAVSRHRGRLGSAADSVSALWRTKQLEYTWLRSLMGRHADFWQVTQDALDYALEAAAVSDLELRNAIVNTYLELDCYPDVKGTLEKLKAGGLQLVILSNGTPAMLEAAVKSSGLTDLINGILSVEEVGIYKPDPRVYGLAVDRLGLQAKQIAFMSANSWDAVGAANYGLRVAWVNRFGQRRERLPSQPDLEINSLAYLPTLLGVDA